MLLMGGLMQEPAVVKVLPTSVWDTDDNTIKAKITTLKFDPRFTQDASRVISIMHCNSRRNLYKSSKCALLCLKSMIGHCFKVP